MAWVFVWARWVTIVVWWGVVPLLGQRLRKLPGTSWRVGAHSAQTVLSWGCPRVFDADRVAAYMTQSPDAWSDGSLVLDSVSGASVAGSGIYSLLHGAGWACGHVDQVRAGADGRSGYCRAFCSVPGPFQLWGGVLAIPGRGCCACRRS